MMSFNTESHRWTFAEPCTTSCADERNISSLNMIETGGKLRATHLILNPENFLPEYKAGFSVGFWLTITGRVNVGECGYSAQFNQVFPARVPPTGIVNRVGWCFKNMYR